MMRRSSNKTAEPEPAAPGVDPQMFLELSVGAAVEKEGVASRLQSTLTELHRDFEAY